MEFRLSEDQIALRDGIRAFCDGRVPNEQFAVLIRRLLCCRQ